MIIMTSFMKFGSIYLVSTVLIFIAESRHKLTLASCQKSSCSQEWSPFPIQSKSGYEFCITLWTVKTIKKRLIICFVALSTWTIN
jgi:hypothetical protein